MNHRIIDLSIPISNDASEPKAQKIVYYDHLESCKTKAAEMGVEPEDFPEKRYLAYEIVTASSHAGTHMDAPYHFSPVSEGSPSWRIDEVPLEWCYGNGVRLDFRHKKMGEYISRLDIENGLKKINYSLQAYDIVLIWTGTTDKYLDHEDFYKMNPGVTVEATSWLIDQGIKVIGIDAWSFDHPMEEMMEAFKKGEKDKFYPVHYFGKEKNYSHVEKLTNMGSIPRSTGFKLALFPVKIKDASSGWVRAVAIIEG